MTFRELAAKALDRDQHRLAESTRQTDRQRLPPFLAAFGEVAASAVTMADVEHVLVAIRRRTCGPTANRHRSLGSKIFSYGVRSGVLASNPVTAVPRYPEHDGRVRFLDSEEEASLQIAVGRRWPEVELALNTGMRYGEQYGLKWESVDLERGILMANGKTGRRFLPINSAATAAIRKLHQTSAGSPFVCPREWRRWFKAACEVAKVHDFHWHDLRHTFASRLVMKGVDLSSVQKLLGHRSIVTTQRYAHLSPEHLRSAVDSLTKKANPQMALFATRP